MSKFETNISKKDFLTLQEEDIMFITNPGRMGDEDGITFVVKKNNEYIEYRVSGWLYPNKDIAEKDQITIEDARKQFPKWQEAWKHGREEDFKGKYKYLYMGFGNGLSVDSTIYSEFEPYLNKLVEEYLKDTPEKEKESLIFVAKYNVWKEALREMTKEKKIILR